MYRTALLSSLLSLFVATAAAQQVRAIDRAGELADRLQLDAKLTELDARTEELAKDRIGVVLAAFKQAGLSPQAQAELERLAGEAAKRIAESWSRIEAVSRFEGVLATRLSLPELEEAIVLYSDRNRVKTLEVICRADDLMRRYVHESSEGVSRTALPELLQAARKLR